MYVCSCTHLELDDENVCSPYLSHMIFNHASESHNKMIANRIDQLKVLLERTSEKCRINGLLLGCSIIFIPCNLTTGAPIPLCSNDCSNFASKCYIAFSAWVDIARINEIPFIRNCENMLSHLNLHYNYPNSSSDFKDNCLVLPGMLPCDYSYVCMSKF